MSFSLESSNGDRVYTTLHAGLRTRFSTSCIIILQFHIQHDTIHIYIYIYNINIGGLFYYTTQIIIYKLCRTVLLYYKFKFIRYRFSTSCIIIYLEQIQIQQNTTLHSITSHYMVTAIITAIITDYLLLVITYYEIPLRTVT